MKKKKVIDPFKRITNSIIIFMVALIFAALANFSFGSSFKFLPRWLEAFVVFIVAAYILFFIAMLRLWRFNKSFKYAFITLGISMVVLFLSAVCETSNDGTYLVLAKAFSMSQELLTIVFYCYFFFGCREIFIESNKEKDAKKTLFYIIALIGLEVLSFLIARFAKFPFIAHNIVANRIFAYTPWVLQFVISFYAMAIAIVITIRVHKIRKEVSTNEQVEKLPE